MNVTLNQQFEGWQDLTYKEMNKAISAGMKKVQKEFIKEGKSALAAVFKNTNKKREGYVDTVASGIRGGKVNITDDTIASKVKSGAKKTPNSARYKLNFLNEGTVSRYTKTIKLRNKKTVNYKRYTGTIKVGSRHKRLAEEKTEMKANSIFNQALQDATKKINSMK